MAPAGDVTLPSVDQNVFGQWSEMQLTQYNKLALYLMKGQADFRKFWPSWNQLFTKVPWSPNMGDTMRQVAAEPTPVQRQQAFPQLLNTAPLTDVVSYRERTADASLRMQDFVSPHFNFLPEFQDFMKHIDTNQVNIDRQVAIFEDMVYRTHCFHRAPFVWVAGVGLVNAPTGTGDSSGTTGKDTAWLQAQIAAMQAVGNNVLSLSEVFRAMSAAETEVGMTPFEGAGKPNGPAAVLNDKFSLIHSGENWNSFIDDPWTLTGKSQLVDLVTEGFQGSLFGRTISKLERYPLRMAIDENSSPTFPNPEIIEENTGRDDFGRTKPNPNYSKRDGSSATSGAPVEVAFLMGNNPAEVINVGPPPNEFTKKLDQGAATAMNWNGKSYLTKNFLVLGNDTGGTAVFDANSFGRYLRVQASLATGIVSMNIQNCLPILHMRRQGLSTVA